MIRLKKITNSARDENCTINGPYCNYLPETVRFIHHRTLDDGAGTGIKPDDICGCFACSACDLWLGEGNRGSKETDPIKVNEYLNRQWYWFRGVRRTLRRLIEKEVLK